MLAANYSIVKSKLKEYFDRVTDHHETVIVTWKEAKMLLLSAWVDTVR